MSQMLTLRLLVTGVDVCAEEPYLQQAREQRREHRPDRAQVQDRRMQGRKRRRKVNPHSAASPLSPLSSSSASAPGPIFPAQDQPLRPAVRRAPPLAVRPRRLYHLKPPVPTISRRSDAPDRFCTSPSFFSFLCMALSGYLQSASVLSGPQVARAKGTRSFSVACLNVLCRLALATICSVSRLG